MKSIRTRVNENIAQLESDIEKSLKRRHRLERAPRVNAATHFERGFHLGRSQHFDRSRYLDLRLRLEQKRHAYFLDTSAPPALLPPRRRS